MKNFFLLITIILSFNLFAQTTTLSGGGLRVTFTNDLQNITVKWSNTNNNVVTKSGINTGWVVVNSEKYILYKVKNSTDYFLIKPSISWFGQQGYNIDYYNELGSLYWAEIVYHD